MSSIRFVLVLALTATVAAGVLALWTPFGVDQALFVYGARTIAQGEVLYRSFWDIKPPGIFGFYALAGESFGYSEVGIHLAEAIWQLLLAVTLYRLARLGVTHRSAALLAPIAALGPYWAYGGPEHLTQVEALVGLPIAACLLLIVAVTDRRPTSVLGLLLGLLMGLIAAMKPLYMILPLAFIAVAATAAQRDRERPESEGASWRFFGFAGVGFSLVWLPMISYFLVNGALREFLWTTFIYPRDAFRDVASAPAQRLVSSAAWMVRTLVPYGLLLAVGLGALKKPRRPVLVYGVVAYLLVALALILVQKLSWWEYHFVLLFPPSGLLVSLGLDRILGLQSVRRLPATASVALFALLLMPLALHLTLGVVDRAQRLHRARQMVTDATVAIRLDAEYLKIWNRTRFLRRPSESRPGPIYVFGDFRHVLASERRQAIAVHGHAWHHLPHGLIREQADLLMAAEPPYLFVSGFYRRFLRQETPDLWGYIVRHYRPIKKHGTGRWYRRRLTPRRLPPQTGSLGAGLDEAQFSRRIPDRGPLERVGVPVKGGHQLFQGRGTDALRPIAESLLRCVMDLDQQARRAGRDARMSECRNPAPIPTGMGGIDDDRQMRLLFDDRYGREIEHVPSL